MSLELTPKTPPYYTIEETTAKIYTAIVTQTGTSAPTATVIKNTTGATLTWARVNAGQYTITASEPIFTQNKTTMLTTASAVKAIPSLNWQSTTVMEVWTYGADIPAALADFQLTNQTIQIIIYP